MKDNETDRELFITAYLTHAISEGRDESGNPLIMEHGIQDIQEESIQIARAECIAFIKQNIGDLSRLNPQSAGRDFWITRSGSIAGFWDRFLGEAGNRLIDASIAAGERCIYKEHDGWLYIYHG